MVFVTICEILKDNQILEFFLYEFETVFCCFDFPPTFDTLSRSASLTTNSKKARYAAGMFPIEKALTKFRSK